MQKMIEELLLDGAEQRNDLGPATDRAKLKRQATALQTNSVVLLKSINSANLVDMADASTKLIEHVLRVNLAHGIDLARIWDNRGDSIDIAGFLENQPSLAYSYARDLEDT